ncbi:MAG: hypothetical protein R8K20_09745 [Gallionellaceae bacterium]
MALIIPGYYDRAIGVGNNIKLHAEEVREAKVTEAQVMPDSKFKLPKKEENLVKYFLRHKNQGSIDEEINNIQPKILHIWTKYSFFIGIMTLFPFTMLGIRIAFREKRSDIKESDRINSLRRDWWMKLLVAYTIATGWLYTVNPLGRGASTLSEYINTQDIFTNNTLPSFIVTTDVPLVVAGFLGWYLNLTSYFISKLYYDDVFGTRIYRFLVGKLLFTYGISLVISAVEVDQGKIALFLIGYFPLSALNMLKELGTKVLQGGVQDKGALSQLPSISRAQLLRLHEEGIDSISALAIYPGIEEIKKYQRSIAPLLDLWVDYARLYSIVGEDVYAKIKGICSTASEFLLLYKTPEFQKSLEEIGVKNPEEIARLIRQTFPMNEELVPLAPAK